MYNQTFKTFKTACDHISKHREDILKLEAQRFSFDELKGLENVAKHCLECLIYLLNRRTKIYATIKFKHRDGHDSFCLNLMNH